MESANAYIVQRPRRYQYGDSFEQPTTVGSVELISEDENDDDETAVAVQSDQVATRQTSIGGHGSSDSTDLGAEAAAFPLVL